MADVLPTPLLIGTLWIVAASVVAFLPMRHQYVPGVALLLAAPVLIVWLGVLYGPWLAAFAVFAFLSMFRNPLRYFARKAMGRDA